MRSNLELEYQDMMRVCTDNSKQLKFYETIKEVGHDIFVEKITPEQGIGKLAIFETYMEPRIALGYVLALKNAVECYEKVYDIFGKYYPSALMNNIKPYDQYINYNDAQAEIEEDFIKNHYEENNDKIEQSLSDYWSPEKEHKNDEDKLEDQIDSMHRCMRRCYTDNQEKYDKLTNDAILVAKALDKDWDIPTFIKMYRKQL